MMKFDLKLECRKLQLANLQKGKITKSKLTVFSYKLMLHPAKVQLKLLFSMNIAK